MTRSRKSSSSKTRNPLFQRWIAGYPDLKEHIHEEDWADFFQFIILALTGKKTERIYRFLDFYLPRLLRNAVTPERIYEALKGLRTLFLNEIPTGLSVDKHQRVSGQIIDHFDTVLMFTQEKLLRFSEPGLGRENRQIEAQLSQLRTMAFYTRGNRFLGQSYQNPAFHEWTDTDPGEHIARPIWESQIHPDDYLQLPEKLRSCVDKQQSLYELNYRLKNKDGEWEHVVELGRILYDDTSKASGYLGVISIASPSSQHLTQDFELISIFRLLLDEEKDHAMLLDMEGRVLFATPNISPYLKTSNNTDLALTDHIFFDLLDNDNEIVARRSWDSFLEQPEDGRKLLLKLQDNHLQNRIIEFSYQSIYSTFKKKLICLSGRVVSKRSSSEVFLEQSSGLQSLFKNPEYTPQEDFRKLLDIAMKLVPGAQFAALLEKTHLGYQFNSGIGLETNQLQDLVLLDKTTVRRIKALDELAGIDETVRRVLLSETRDKLFSVLPDARRDLILNQGRLGSTDELLLGKIRLNGESHSLIVLGTSGEDTHFSEKDMFLLQLLLNQSSVLLGNAIMTKELAESNQNYHQLLQHAPLACFVVQENRIRSFNPFFKDMLGYEQDEMLVRDLWRHLHPDDLQRFQMDIAAVTERYSVMDMEIRLIDKQKQELYCSGALLRVNRNQQPAVLCIAFDQTKLRMLEEKIVENEQGEVTSSLLAGIVHDFNNILGTIIPASQLIMKRPDSPKTHNRAKIIFRMAQRAYQMNQGLLKLPEREGADGQEKLDIKALLRDNHKTFRRILGTDIRLDYVLPDEDLTVNGDYKLILQALLNLLINAKEAISGSGNITIRASGQQVKEQNRRTGEFRTMKQAVIAVEDNGSGISQDIRAKIFEPFFSTKPKGKAAGLGLNIVQRIMKQHSGSVLVRGNQDGTTFKLCLPMLQEETHAAPPVKETNGTLPHSSNGKAGGKILVVDDEQYLREVFVSMLKLNGYSCYEASSGTEAIALYKKRHAEIDLIILDYAMPGMSGTEAYRQLKQINASANIMLCTGYADQKEISGFIKNGDMEYLPKPFTIEILNKKVRRALKQRRTLQQSGKKDTQ